MSDDLAFLNGGGEAARLIRERDWSARPLGAPAHWPADLRVALSLVLNSPESMILAWGPELHFFFNEAYFPLLGPRLAWAMGERFDTVWADAWQQARPIIDAALAAANSASSTCRGSWRPIAAPPTRGGRFPTRACSPPTARPPACSSSPTKPRHG